MAIQRKNSFAVNIGALVANAVDSAKKVRAQATSAKEAEFQKAVAGGMSYDAQVAFRQQQIGEARASSIVDSDYIASLEKSMGDLQRLNRFSKYRSKYQSSFAELRAGRETAQEHLDLLNNLFSTATDPDLKEEIRTNIITAETDLKTYRDNILTNQVKKAQYDGTPEILNTTITQVKDRRAMAVLNDNQEEATALDATLSVLQQQLNKVSVENTQDKLEVTSISKGLGAKEKVAAINSEIAGANNTDPVTIDGKRYGSVADYWTQTRDAYLSGNGKGIFSDFFKELSDSYSSKINAAISRDGFATTLTLDGIKNETNELKSKPELAPYLEQVTNLQSIALAGAFQSTAKTIIDRASYTGDYQAADTALQSYATQYGVDAQTYRLQLGNALTQDVARSAAKQKKSEGQVLSENGLTNVLKADEFAIPTPKTDVPKVDAPSRVFTPKETTDLTAAKQRIDAGKGSATDKQNVAYAEKQGWKPAIAPATSVAPVAPLTPPTATPNAPTPIAPVAPTPPTPTTATPPAPAQTTTQPTNNPAPAPVMPTAPTPTPAPVANNPAPTPAATPKAYTGTSVVDYLKLQGKDNSFAYRTKLASDNGIKDYTGSAEQNTALLKKLQGGV